ncbi:MAG: 50S ribosomal protein L35 [Elusimicrobia bacterium]|nr:50S ribosomal protein L35 [Elusimicrobiota bacterium]
MANKSKTHSGAKKRFKVTATGKIKRGHSNASHIMSKKNAKRRRRLRKSTLVKGKEGKELRKLLGV